MMQLGFLLLAGVFYGIQSYIQFHTGDEESFWTMGGWRRKYDMTALAPNTWYYKFFNLKYREKFCFSGTVLVFLTDAFHLMQFLTIKMILFAASVQNNNINWWIFFGGWFIWALGFNLSYFVMSNKRAK